MSGDKLPTVASDTGNMQVCAGLEAMHAKALAHRDVKPHNVLLRPISSGSSMATTSIATASASSDSAHLMGSPGVAARSQGCHHAVLIDFGSTQPAHVVVHNRAEAVALQEVAEVGGCCTGAVDWRCGCRCS